MGPAVAVAAIGGVIAGGIITKSELEFLKNEINRIIARFQYDLDNFAKLEKILK